MLKVVALASLANGERIAMLSATEMMGSSVLCRCELKGTSAFGDCIREDKKSCLSAQEIDSRLKVGVKKMDEAGLADASISCKPININGEGLFHASYPTLLNTHRLLPEGVPMCEPSWKYGGDSPLQTLAEHHMKFEKDSSLPPPQNGINDTAPVSLLRECMYCQGARSTGECQCCTPTSDFTMLELPEQCRLHNTVGGPGAKTYTALSKNIADKMINEGRMVGEACCSGRAVYSLNRQWECRNEVGNEELLWQMTADNVDKQYRKAAYHRFMWDTYRTKVLPMEQNSLFHFYDDSPMTSGEITQKPLVMLVGSYSSGKTTFIKHALGEDYIGSKIGVEPTTDRFTIVQSGEARIVPGFALTSDPTNHYQGVARDLGIGFQRHFQASQVPNPMLNDISFLDTPGVLSGKKQGVKARGYDFEAAVDWFAERADVVLLFFDVYRLDVSDELARIVKVLTKNGRHRKVRIILNKADLVTPQELMRVYGTIMWYIAPVVQSPEVLKVFMGNFGGFEYQNTELGEYFDEEYATLMNSVLRDILPAQSATRKVDQFIERIRRLKAHAMLMDKMRVTVARALPHAKKKTQKRLVDTLEEVIASCAKTRGVNLGDFQDADTLREKFRKDMENKDLRLTKMGNLNKRLLKNLEEALQIDLPRLVDAVSKTYGQNVDVQALTKKTFGVGG